MARTRDADARELGIVFKVINRHGDGLGIVFHSHRINSCVINQGLCFSSCRLLHIDFVRVTCEDFPQNATVLTKLITR